MELFTFEVFLLGCPLTERLVFRHKYYVKYSGDLLQVCGIHIGDKSTVMV